MQVTTRSRRGGTVTAGAWRGSRAESSVAHAEARAEGGMHGHLRVGDEEEQDETARSHPGLVGFATLITRLMGITKSFGKSSYNEL